jgi:diguanylate cyclase (GGDEF)-like protein
MENHSRLVRDSATGEPKEYVVVMRDVSERKKLEDKLSASALTDAPTGLANRRAFDGALELEWKRTVRRGSHISLLMLDVAPRNGTREESQAEESDDAMRTAAAALSGVLRTTDFVARYDGSEIAVILPTADIANATKVAQRVRSAVESLVAPDGEKREGGWLIANIGVATGLARHGGTMKMPETLLMAADHAVQESMREGQTFCAWQVDYINFGGLVWPTAAR